MNRTSQSASDTHDGFSTSVSEIDKHSEISKDKGCSRNSVNENLKKNIVTEDPVYSQTCLNDFNNEEEWPQPPSPVELENELAFVINSPLNSPTSDTSTINGCSVISPCSIRSEEAIYGCGIPLPITNCTTPQTNGCQSASASSACRRGPPPPVPIRTCANLMSPRTPGVPNQQQIYYNVPACGLLGDRTVDKSPQSLVQPHAAQQAALPLVVTEASMYKSSTTINSFTTEDTDMFPSAREKREESSGQNAVVSRQKKSNLTKAQKSMRRRSKSVGAPGFRLKFNLFNEKPRVPVNPKFTELLVTGLGLPVVPSIESISSSSSDTRPRSHTPSASAPQNAGDSAQSSDGQAQNKHNNSPLLRRQRSEASDKKSTVKIKSNKSSNNEDVKSESNYEKKCGCERPAESGDPTSRPDVCRVCGGKRGGSKRLTRQERLEREKQICSREFDEFDVSASDSEESESASDYADLESLGLTRPLNEILGPDADNNVESRGHMIRAYQLASELLSTERTYVKRLHLIDQVFHFTVVVKNRELHMFPNDVIPQMFSNIKSIYQFHHDFLLPQLERRMSEWKQIPRIGDVMKRFAPFLKLYTEYVSNFDHAMNSINQWMDKCPRFLKIVQDIEAMPECEQLAMHHHMLEPIQRVPRYELLLKAYVRHVTPNTEEEEDAKKALDLVTTAASHTNTAMQKMERFRKLLDINEGLGGAIDLISPTRDFIKEGKMMRISARDGSLMERILFLFTDMLLVCSSLPLKIGHRQQYKIKSRIDVDGMQVEESHNLDMPNTFYVKGKQKSVEMHTSSSEEKYDWIMTLNRAVGEMRVRQMSRWRLKGAADTLTDNEFGRRAPLWVRDKETSMCMCCSVAFTAIRRRHHCRACGIVICGKCSTKKAKLAFAGDNRDQRVCDPCFAKIDHLKASGDHVAPADIKQPGTEPTSAAAAASASSLKAPVVLQVKASDPAVMSSYLNMSTTSGKSWVRRWFSVHNNFVLYSYKANQDIIALTSLPLPGYQISAATEGDPNYDKSFRVFKFGQNKSYLFQADSATVRDRWMQVLQSVVLAELPASVTAQNSADKQELSK